MGVGARVKDRSAIPWWSSCCGAQALKSPDMSGPGIRLKDLAVQSLMGLLVKFPNQVSAQFNTILETWVPGAQFTHRGWGVGLPVTA